MTLANISNPSMPLFLVCWVQTSMSLKSMKNRTVLSFSNAIMLDLVGLRLGIKVRKPLCKVKMDKHQN